MNINEIHKLVKKQREIKFLRSPQLSLGELIQELEKVGIYDSVGKPKHVCFDFGSALPTTLDSWRGSYDELALGYTLSGYDGSASFEDSTAPVLLNELKSAIGKEYTGWKGGDYVMNEKTPLWVDNSGNANNTGIVGVLDCGWRLVILTSYFEY
jgi:hypothetical protein